MAAKRSGYTWQTAEASAGHSLTYQHTAHYTSTRNEMNKET